MTASIRFFVAVLTLATTAPVSAAELSPWLGSADQMPFQVDSTTLAAVDRPSDALQTGSLSTAPCPPSGCVTAPDAATSSSAAEGLSKN